MNVSQIVTFYKICCTDTSWWSKCNTLRWPKQQWLQSLHVTVTCNITVETSHAADGRLFPAVTNDTTKKRPLCSWIVTGAQPNVHWCRQPLQSHCSVHASSSSTSTPSQSLGWRNITGFPWAPNLGSADRVLIFFAFRSAIAALMSSTCRKGSERVTINSSARLEKSLRYYHPCVQKMCSWRRSLCTAHFLFGYYK